MPSASYAARENVSLARYPKLAMIRSIKSVETSLVLRLRIAVIREREVGAREFSDLVMRQFGFTDDLNDLVIQVTSELDLCSCQLEKGREPWQARRRLLRQPV